MSSPSKCKISCGIPITPTSRAASSPARTTSFSISRSALATASSILDGLIRPSFIKRSRAYRATWRRIGSKEESTTIPGVSSTIISTPVARWRAWILRPSLPMMRPFISSSGNFKAVTVRSAVTSEDMRSIAVTSRAWAVSSMSRRSSFCSLVIKPTRSSLISFSVILISLSLASSLVRPAIFSNFSCCLSRIWWISSFKSSISRSLLVNFSERFSSWSKRLSSEVSRSERRFSVWRQSLRRASSSCWDLSAILPASFLALRTMSAASFLALRIRSSALALPPDSFFLL